MLLKNSLGNAYIRTENKAKIERLKQEGYTEVKPKKRKEQKDDISQINRYFLSHKYSSSRNSTLEYSAAISFS